jgi:hypothetical protein
MINDASRIWYKCCPPNSWRQCGSAEVVLFKTRYMCVWKEDSVSHKGRKSLRVDTKTPITKENGVVPNGCHRGSPSQDKVS